MSPDGSEIVVRMGEYAVSGPGEILVVLGLGSCVAVVLDDPSAHVGAVAHILLPSQSLSRRTDNPGRSPDTAVPLVLAALDDAGASRAALQARLVGGAAMFADLLPTGAVHMGERNVVACRSALSDAGIPVVAEAVGGRRGRSLWFDVGAGHLTVRSVGGAPEIL